VSAVELVTERRRPVDNVATVNEAAFVAGVSRHAVNQAIDRGEIRIRLLRRKTDRPGRAIGDPELIYLCLQMYLSLKARKEAYRQLAGHTIDTMPVVIELADTLKLDLRDTLANVRHKLGELGHIRSQVEENPEIRGGEPVFHGTRIPVHMIADFLGAGVPHDELLEDYPALTEESLTVAAIYSQLYPRRGRPRQAPWRSGEPAHVFNAEDLRKGNAGDSRA
jgi:uncharacterized protein (DUF433 family)